MLKTWKRASALLLAATLVVGGLLAGGGALRAADAPASLYHRLGGYDAIAAVTDDFFARLAQDPTLAHFFGGLSKDSMGKFRQRVVEQICYATGGPCVYTGRDTKTAHAGLGVTEADWNATVKHFVASLDKFKVGDKEKTDLLALVSTLKKDIVEKP
jgi:hemoglobin